MNDKSDWRLTNQMNYLNGVELIKVKYKMPTEKWDHDHCSFCWKKFDDESIEGYCTVDHYHWICDECFEDFKMMFNWKVSE